MKNVHGIDKCKLFNKKKCAYIHPVDMVLKVINGVRDQLHVALLEVRLVNGDAPQLGGAHRRKVAGVREEHAPTVDSTRRLSYVRLNYFKPIEIYRTCILSVYDDAINSLWCDLNVFD